MSTHTNWVEPDGFSKLSMSVTQPPLVSVIIVSYNTRDLTIQTLHSVLEEAYSHQNLRGRVEVIIVDNNSSDSSVADCQLVSERAPKGTLHSFEIIENTTNTGFAKANNQGINKSSANFVWLLNSDTIVKPGALAALVYKMAELSSQRYGVLAAQLLNEDGTVQSQGGSLPDIIPLAVHMVSPDNLPFIPHSFSSTQYISESENEDGVIPAGWVGGTAMLLSKKMLAEIGLLDEHIFMYGEDMELCVRAQRAGWKVGIVPAAEVIHFQSASSTPARALQGEIDGYRYIAHKHYSPVKRLIIWKLLLFGMLLRWISFGILNSPKRAVYGAIICSLWSPLKNT